MLCSKPQLDGTLAATGQDLLASERPSADFLLGVLGTVLQARAEKSRLLALARLCQQAQLAEQSLKIPEESSLLGKT